jgi:stage II sporulation protein D
VKSTQSSQVYKGVPKKGSSPKSGPGVRDTKGIVLTYATDQGERIFCTYYSSTCGGSNQDAAPVKNEPFVEPLRGGVECDYCKDSPFYRWGPVKLSKRSMTIQLRERYEKFDKLGRIEQIKVHQATPEGRPVILSLIDMEGKAIRLEAENFRLAVDPSAGRLRSNWFTPVSEPDSIIFANGRGFGHGIGMCQYGADTLGRKGWPAGRILRYYYPTALLTRAYE